MPYQAELHYDIPIWRETAAQGRVIESVQQGVLHNPYVNLLDLLQHLFHLATTANETDLTEFANCGDLNLESHGSERSRYSLFLLQMTPGPEKPGWYEFDPQAYTQFLQEPLLQACFDGQAYRHVDYYLVGLVELRLLQLSRAAQDTIQSIWYNEGMLDFYWDAFPMRRVLAQAYQLMPWQWFCQHGHHDILSYRGALLAALSCWNEQKDSPDGTFQLQVQQDLIAMHDQFVLSAAEALTQNTLVSELREAFLAAIDETALPNQE